MNIPAFKKNDSKCYALVVTHEGKRVSWKISSFALAAHGLNIKHYGGLPIGDCQVLVREFSSFEAGRLWLLSFERHPNHRGDEPVDRDMTGQSLTGCTPFLSPPIQRDTRRH